MTTAPVPNAAPVLGAALWRRPSVLFACRANAGRSVTARILAERYAAGHVDVYSAGSEPGTEIHPEVAHALVDLSLDVSDEIPKPFDPDAHYTAVITMGCGEACPYYAGAQYDDWPIADPKRLGRADHQAHRRGHRHSGP